MLEIDPMFTASFDRLLAEALAKFPRLITADINLPARKVGQIIRE